MIRQISFFILILGLQFPVSAQETDEMFTIYLVRHAEKELSAAGSINPSLTECGKARAKSLADFFEDIELDAVYSTDYLRTKNTAKPTAKKQDLEIEIYMPGKLEELALQLIRDKKNALIVGHSNTTGVLAGLLAGKEIGPFDDKIYNRIYQVTIHDNTARLQVFHSAFSCEE